MTRWMSRLAAFALPFVTWFAATAAPGDWDRSFAQAGRLAFTIPGIGFSVRDWVPQPDGKIVVVGHALDVNSNETNDYVVARFNLDGTPDASFDGDGYRLFSFGSTVIGTVGIERQADGKLLIAGQAGPGSGDVHLLRLAASGARDVSYGLGGEVTITFANNTAYANPAFTLDANGNAIVVSGYYVNPPGVFGKIAVTRITSAGAIDATFGASGTAFLESTAAHLFATYVNVAADGKIVVAGESGPYGNQSPLLARLTANGQPDSSFGTGGVVPLPFLNGDGFSSAIAVAPDGKVVFAGERKDGNGNDVWFLSRFTNAGTPDPTFGSAGRIVLDRGGIQSLVIEPDGKIVVAGWDGRDIACPALSRYNSDGSPDVSFGLRGTRPTDFSTGGIYSGGALSRLHRNTDGTYLSLVTTNEGASNIYALARFVAQGTSPGVLGIRTEFETGGGQPALVNEANQAVTLRVYRTGGSDGTVSVQYRTVASSATAGQDFVAKTGTVTLNDGETDATFDIQILDDSIQEMNFGERFDVELFSPTGGAGLSKDRVQFEIMPDNDWGQRIALYGIDGYFSEAGSARFLLNRSGDMSGALTLNYAVTSGSASAGSDYTATTGSVQWTSNQGGFKEFSVPLVNDGAIESTEDFTVTVTDPAGAVPTQTVTTHIVDDDSTTGTATIAFAANGIYVNENAGTATWTVNRLGDATQALNVPWSLSTGSGSSAAGENIDFVPASGTLSWNAGERGSKSIVVALVNDSVYEPLETFSVGLDLSSGVAIAGTPFATAFIKDDDGTPSQPVISIGSDMTVNESAGTISIPVTLTGTPDAYVTVDYNGMHETTNGNDVVIPAGGLAWAPGESGVRMITVPIFNDAQDEIDESFVIYISRPTVGASLGRSQMRATILDNDPTPAGQPAPVAPGAQVTSSNVTASEGTRTLNVDFKRVGDTLDFLTVYLSASDGTATSPADYVLPVGQIGWGPNDTTPRHVEIQINGDAVAEPDETFTLNYASFTIGNTATPASVPITIVDDDTPTQPARVGFVSASKSISESQTSVMVAVSRSGDLGVASSVDYATTAGSAGAADFTATTGTLTWAANDNTVKNITVPLLTDTIDEPDEAFTLSLSNPSSGTLLDTSLATITIQDDDLPPPPARVGFTNALTTVQESSTVVNLEVSRSGDVSGPLSVSYLTSVGSAGAGDFTGKSGTLTWAANDAAPQSITISLLPDTIDEADESFTVTLNTPSGALLDRASATVAIVDDDASAPAPARVSMVDAVKSVSEGAASVTLQVTRSGNTAIMSSITYATSGGTAGFDDYVTTAGIVSWDIGETGTKSFTIPLKADTLDEPDETFIVTLTGATDGTALDSAITTVTIVDDDLPAPPLPAHVGVMNTTQAVSEGQSSVMIQIGRSGNTAGTSSVDYATAAGTAGASDYTTATGTLTWAANDTTTKSITVTLLPDATDEPDETFTLTLSNPSSGTTLDGVTTTVTITDDDATPPAGGGSSGGGSSGGGGGKGGGSESVLSLLALAALLLVRSRRRHSGAGAPLPTRH